MLITYYLLLTMPNFVYHHSTPIRRLLFAGLCFNVLVALVKAVEALIKALAEAVKATVKALVKAAKAMFEALKSCLITVLPQRISNWIRGNSASHT